MAFKIGDKVATPTSKGTVKAIQPVHTGKRGRPALMFKVAERDKAGKRTVIYPRVTLRPVA